MARRFVVGSVTGWGMERFNDDAALCTAELVTNAVLHARTPIALAVRPIRSGVRVDVQDGRPDRLPAVLPATLEPLQTGTTGRGLRLVQGLASRWGYFNTDVAKTVWAELSDERTEPDPSPLVEIGLRAKPATMASIRLVGLPVAAAMASGVQVDDLVRAIQMEPQRLSMEEEKEFLDLLERSAPFRLMGRHEAYRAAAEGRDRVTVDVPVEPGDFEALAGLDGFLRKMATDGRFEAGRVGPEVAEMRSWLAAEAAAQLRGEPPRPYPS